MADVTLKYKGATIAELSESGNKTIETAGKYCEADILLEYVKSGGKITNLINDLPLTPGYYGSNGAISAASSTQKEVITAKFDVTPNDYIICIVKIPATNRNHWCSVGFFTGEDTWISRATAINSGALITMAAAVQVPSNAYKAALTFRTYGNCEAAAFAVSDLMALTDMYQITQ